jgi:hypothetical protein
MIKCGNFQRAIAKLRKNPGTHEASYGAKLTPSEIQNLLDNGADFYIGSSWKLWETKHREEIRKNIACGISKPKWYYLTLTEDMLKFI